MMRPTSPPSPTSNQVNTYITPSKMNKTIGLSHPLCSYLLTDHMAPVRATISQGMHQRFTVKQGKNGAQLIRCSPMVQVAPSLAPKTTIRVSKQKLTLQRVQQLIRIYGVNINQKVKIVQRYKEMILERISRIQSRRKKMRELKKRLILTECRRNNHAMIKQYFEYLLSEKNVSKKIVDDFESDMRLKKEQIEVLNIDINYCLQHLTQYKLQSNLSQQNLQQAQSKLCILHTKINELSAQKVPEEGEIIKGMFLVGILQEQIEIFSQIKVNGKGKLSKRSCPPIRVVRIKQCSGYVGKFKIFTSVYMFCQSLLLSNIKLLMECTPFFAQEEKYLYHYDLYTRKMSYMMHQLKGEQCQSKIKDTQTQIDKTINLCVESSSLSRVRDIFMILSRTHENIYRLGRTSIKLLSMSQPNFTEFANQALSCEESSLFLDIEWAER